MDNDIDIYADLPNINLNTEQNDQLCNCKELNKKLSLLTNELENLQKIENNLKNNLSSLLKTAKAEIARKDKMIDDLRKRLDDTTFRRNRVNEFQSFSTRRMPNQQYNIIKADENIPTMQEIESKSHQTEFCQDKSKNKRIENDIDPIPTVFGERIKKKIVETIKEEEKQKMSLRINKGKVIAEESNKENGSRSSVNNNDNESTSIIRNSGTEISYMKNSEKRAIEEDDTYRNKRLKTEDNKDETANGESYYNCITEYDLKDDLAQHEIKDNFAKFNDQLDIARSFKKEQTLFDITHRTVSEDTKQSRSNNEWKREERNDSRRDYDNSRSKKGSIDNLRNYRNASISNHLSEGPNNEYKNGCRYSPSRRHYSKSRSDHESSSSHRLRERSNRTYRDRRYDDYEYNDRYRNGRLKKDYDSKEYDNNKSRYGSREHGDLRDRFKHSSSDVEDSFYKHKKYKTRGQKESTPSISDNKKLYENDKTVAAIDLRASLSQNVNIDQNIEDKTKNEQNIKFANSSENTAMHIAMNLSNLEEGEILDSPEKKNNSVYILRNNEIVNNNVKIIENKIKDLANASIDDKINLQNNNSTKQKVADIKLISKTEVTLQPNLEDNRKVMQVNNGTNNEMTDEHNCNINKDTCRSRSIKNSTDDTRDIATIEQMCDNNINDNCENHVDKKLKIANTENPIKIKDTNNSNAKEVNKIKKLNKFDSESVESVIKKEEIKEAIKEDSDIESAIKSAELNHFNDDSNHKTEVEKLENFPAAKLATKVEIIFNCDTENKDKIELQDKNKIYNGISDKSDVEMSRLCLSDHNYVRDPVVKPTTDSDAVQKSPVMSDCKIVPETALSKETKIKELMNVQLISTSKATSPMTKNKKNQHAKGIVISRRRRVVTLSDSNASMTVLMNKNIAETPAINHDDFVSKPRLRAASSRGSSKNTCK